MLDWVFGLFDKLAQTALLHYLAEHFQWVDWFAILFLVLGVVYGIQNGLLAEVAEIGQIMAVIYLTYEFIGTAANLIRNYLDFVPDDTAKAVAFIATGGCFWGLAALVFKLLRKFFHAQVAAPLRYLGGGLLGGFHLLIIFSFICQAILLLPYHPPKKAFEKGSSYSGRYIADLAPRIHDMVPRPENIASH